MKGEGPIGGLESMKFGWLAMAAPLLVCAACSRTAEMVPLNDAANALGIPRLDATLYGTGYGPVTVTMPNGEVLNGHYRLIMGGSVTTASATAYTPRGSAFATGTAVSTPINNPFTAQAVGNRGTSMICQGSGGGMGHGDAVCTTNSGAQYQMMF